MPVFSQTRVGEPISLEALTVFPLFTEPAPGVDYLLADEAIGSGGVKVEEVGEGGSVPNLLVDNQGDTLVLFLEGEELRGAKQNRVLNASLLAPAKARTTIPVSCVERGRWRHVSPQFGSSPHYSTPFLRHKLRRAVTRSTQLDQTHRAEQAEVWLEVDRQQDVYGTPSPTSAMSDTYEAYQEQLDNYQEKLKYVDGATGLAVAVGNKVVSVDLFDKPATCRKVWDRLLSGTIMQALEPGTAADHAGIDAVQTQLAALQAAPWLQAPAVGAGEEFRAELEGDRHATALVLDGAVVHGSLVAAR